MKRAGWVIIGLCAIAIVGATVARLVQSPTRRVGTAPRHTDGARPRLSPEQERELERIATLGYVAGAEPAGTSTGVLTHVPDATSPGLTLYTGGEGHEAFLIDMEGNVVHSWSYPGSKGWPRARVLPNGDLLVITAAPPQLLRLNVDSELLWRFDEHAHHDLAVLPDGKMWVLVRGITTRPHLNGGQPVIDDNVVLLDGSGRELTSLSLLEAFERSDLGAKWLRDYPFPEEEDIFHTNSIEVLIREGLTQLLLSIRSTDTVALLDVASGKIIWALAGRWHRQHEAQLVGGNLLLFDNLGPSREREGLELSRVIEIDLNTGGMVWSFTERGFFTRRAGAQQRLPNGNTLITESEAGRIIEVARDGRVVWEYVNPKVVEGQPELGLGILRAERIPAESAASWLSGSAVGPPN